MVVWSVLKNILTNNHVTAYRRGVLMPGDSHERLFNISLSIGDEIGLPHYLIYGCVVSDLVPTGTHFNWTKWFFSTSSLNGQTPDSIPVKARGMAARVSYEKERSGAWHHFFSSARERPMAHTHTYKRRLCSNKRRSLGIMYFPSSLLTIDESAAVKSRYCSFLFHY